MRNVVWKGLSDRTRRPFRYANQLPEQIEAAIVAAKREKPNWGARKIRERLLRRLPHARQSPGLQHHPRGAGSSRSGDATRCARERAPRARRFLRGCSPNDLWCTDYKGEFMLADKRYCYPLTVTDHASPLSAAVRGHGIQCRKACVYCLRALFKERGLPRAIRSDNGVPFASPNGLFNLSKLSVWWLRLGISIERIKPGHPQQNGRHERMHLTLKAGSHPACRRQYLAAPRLKTRPGSLTHCVGVVGI